MKTEIVRMIEKARKLSNSEWQNLKEELLKSEEDKLNQKESILTIEERLYQLFKEIGIPAHLKGYKFLKKCIILSLENPRMLERITKNLYPAVARECNSTTSRVERAIRHSIEVVYEIGNLEKLEEIVGNIVSYRKVRPENSVFIAQVVEYIRNN